MVGLDRPPEWQGRWRSRRAARRGEPRWFDAPGHGPGLLLPLRPTPYWQVVLFGLLAAALLAGSAAAVVAAGRGNPKALAALLVFLPAAALFGGGAYAGLRAHRRPLPGLVLTPDHLVLGNYPDPIAVRWDQVTRIGASSIRWGTRPGPDPVTNLVTVHGTDETQLAALPGPARRLARRTLARTGELSLAALAEAVWAMDPVLAYHVLRFYQAHPDRRGELAGAAAPDRVGRRDLML